MITYTEIEIVNGCRAGKREWQKILYEQYKDAMFTICKRILNDEDLACDALQEGFVEVFRGINGFHSNSTIGAWIKTIIIRKAILIGKRFQRMDDFEENMHDIKIHWDDNLTGHDLDLAIQQLPIGYRKVFILIEVEGYSHRETAALLGISEGTSKSQLFHSKKMLQRSLASLRN